MNALRSAGLLAATAVVIASCSRHVDGVSTNATNASADAPAVAPRTNAPLVGPRTSVRGAANAARYAFAAEGDAWSVHGETFTARADGASLRFATNGSHDALVVDAARIDRDSPLALGVAKPSTTSAGSLAIDRGAAREELASSEAGVEQSWTFAARPTGAGDLVLHLATHGLAYASSTSGGLHFGAPGALVRYGQATWVDARGVRTSVASHWENGAIVLRVPASAVDRAAYPATLDPVVSSETALDAPPDYVPASQSQTLPAVAYNGANHFVVWSDPRNAIGGGTVITGTRVSTAGAVLDPTGVILSSTSFGNVQHEVTPAIATEGASGTFLVAWADQGNIVSVIVSGSAPSNPTLVDSASDVAPAIAYASPNYLVVWQSGEGVVGARVDTTNALLDETPFTISTGCTSAPAIASNGTNYLVACTSSTDVFLELVTPAGALVNGGEFAVENVPQGIAVGSDGNNFLVCGSSAALNDEVTCILVNAALTTAISTNVDPGDGADPTHAALSIAYGAGEYAVAFTTQTSPYTFGLRGVLVNQDGSTPGADAGTGGVTFVNDATTSVYPQLDFDGSKFGVVWQDDRNGTDASDVYGSSLSTALVCGAEEILTEDATTETNPSIASDGANLLVAYEHDEATSDASIYAIRVSLAGSPVDLNPIHVESATGARTPYTFSSAPFAPEWAVLWQLGNIQGTGVAVNGVPQNAGPVTASTATSSPSGACDGTYCLFVWQDGRNVGATGQDIYGTLFTSAGSIVGDVAIVQAAGDQLTPSVASTGNGFLVGYVDATSAKAIHLARSGTVLTPGAIVTLTSTPSTFNHPQVATDGANYFQVFDDGNTIWGATVLNAGGVSGALVSVSTGATARSNAVVAWDGYQYVVAWQDQRNASYDIFGARVSGGGLVDLNGFGVALSVEDETNPTIAGEGARISAVAYQSQHAGSTGARVYVRTITDKLTTGTACVSGDECATTNCVDQVCCASACSGTCVACANKDTGQADGVCATVKDLIDPHSTCATPPPLPGCETDTCVAGACATVITQGCAIGGACYAAGAGDPLDLCQVCTPAVSTTAFTAKNCDDGVSCTTDTCDLGVCHNGINAGHCEVAGACFTTGQANPATVCQTCQPGISQTAFENDDGVSCLTDGVSCHENICAGGVCTHPEAPGTCYVSGLCSSTGTSNPGNPCQTCQPNVSTSSYTNDDGIGCTSDGLSCTSDLCSAGVCQHTLIPSSCEIASACYSSGAPNGSNVCQTCQPATSTATFTNADGATCASDGLACTTDVCATGSCAHQVQATACLVSGVCYTSGQANPGNACQTCQPDVSHTSFTSDPDACGDAGNDGGSDAGPDAGGDAGPDAGPGGQDAGPDAGLIGNDAGPDAGDAGIDAGPTATDAGLDASPEGDASTDANSGETDASTGTDASDDESDASGETDGAIAATDGSVNPNDASEDDGEGGTTFNLAPGNSGGCGCRTAPADTNGQYASFGVILGVLALRRRRGRRS